MFLLYIIYQKKSPSFTVHNPGFYPFCLCPFSRNPSSCCVHFIGYILNAKTGSIAEKADHCLITEVLFSDDAEAMFAPMIAYAEEQGIALTGEFYGREETNFYQNGKRLGLYKVYAPIRKKK